MTARKTPLRAVAKDEKPVKPVKPLTLDEAVENGSYLDILKAQRRQMVTDLASTTGPALAALHRQIALHSKEIAALEVAANQEAAESVEVADEAFDAEAL